jgi:hypothetical protein
LHKPQFGRELFPPRCAEDFTAGSGRSIVPTHSKICSATSPFWLEPSRQLLDTKAAILVLVACRNDLNPAPSKNGSAFLVCNLVANCLTLPLLNIGGSMAFSDIINTLRQEEQQLARQLSGIRAALTALGSNLPYIITGRGRKPGRAAKTQADTAPRKRRRLSAKARKAISDAQKKRWAAQRAGAKK